MDNPPELVRSADFWFEDGNIVLQVEYTLYRVYRGLLASRSTVFRDTFGIPQPTEECPTIEGCPVLQLHDESSHFTLFLKALHHYGSFPNCPVSGFNELRSVLELSEKYDVPLLRDSMTDILCSLYPSSLDDWSKAKQFTLPGYASTVHDHISVLNLALKIDIRSILPAVMYAICVAFKPDAIMSGATKRKILSSEYRTRCVVGMTRLAVAKRDALKYLTRDEKYRCSTTDDCDIERFRWMSLELQDDVHPLSDYNNHQWENFGGCSKCCEAVKISYSAARQQLWDDLPSIFDLGSWDELLA